MQRGSHPGDDWCLFLPRPTFSGTTVTQHLFQQQPPDWPTGVCKSRTQIQTGSNQSSPCLLTNTADTEKMLSILRKARLKDKELRILMLCVTRFSFQTQDLN